MDTTVVSDPKKGGNPHFFKQVRMAHAWAQCHLVGINRMMVGVHTLVPGNFAEDHEFDPAYALTSRPKRILQELWLYDVEKMPNAVKISSDEDGFRAWTPTDLKWKLYTALQQIRAQVQHSEDNVTHRFLHYFNEDFLVPLTLEELQFEWKAIHDANRTLTFRNVHMVQTSPDVIELSMEEVEQEHAEKQVDHILNTFLGLGIPIETVKVVRIVGSGRTLEVLFPYEALARRVYTTWRLFSGRNRYLPRGFEKIRVDVKRTKRQELERMRRKGSGNMFYFVAQSAPVRTGEARYTHQHHPYACYQCGGSGGAGAGYSAGPSVIQTGPMPPAPSSSSQQHQRDHGIQFILPGEHYPVPSGRHHHAHHHGHGHAHAHGKHHHGVGMTGPVASSASNVSGGGRTCPRGGAVGGGGTREEREEPWRYTQTMWR
ncbi:hypothetical protein Fcan01_25161 [Folsomia candida]|uniref:Uncharacterized protein n=2 Tax=Folsomia candida TaxID=158441 RepID=A0A226D757_FOLCA|nr:hypothetical protein Fcan01_25161 [Folsomia candida]